MHLIIEYHQFNGAYLPFLGFSLSFSIFGVISPSVSTNKPLLL